MTGPGPWFLAAFQSDCSWGDVIEEGDEIRADGESGWEHRECAELHGVNVDHDPSESDLTVEEMFGW